MNALRPVAVLLLSVALIQLAGGIASLITPLGLEVMRLDSFQIGLVAAFHAIGFLIGTLFANSMIKRIGNIRTFTVAAAGCAISFLLMGLFLNPIFWTFARLLQGIVFALMFTALEAWLSSAVSKNNRGSVIGLYQLSAKIALFLGPLIFADLINIDLVIFTVCALCLCAASLPIGLTYQLEPKSRDTIINRSLAGLLRVSPAASFGVFIAGLVNTGVMALLPIYAQETFKAEGQDTIAAAAYLVSAAMIGGMISQWPAGKLSDLVDRRIVVVALGLIASAASLTLNLFPNLSLYHTITILVIWGAGALSFYGICVAHGMDHADSDEMPALMSTYLFVWALGSIIGPLLAGALMETGLGVKGLFVYACLTHALLATIMFARSTLSAPAPSQDQEDWSPVAPRSTLGSELDPRVEGIEG